MKKRNNQKNKEVCKYESIVECPYNTRSQCPDVKKNCHHPEENELLSKCRQPVWLYVLLASIFLIVISIYFKQSANCFGEIIWDVLLSIGISLSTGAVLFKLINIHQYLEEYTHIVSTSLSTFKYLSSLTREQLSTLRNKVTYELHSKNVPNMPQGFLKLDKKVCELLEHPFYKFYRESIQCQEKGKYGDIVKHIKGEDYNIPDTNLASINVFIKEVTQEYTIKSPFDRTRSIKSNIGISNFIWRPKGCDISEMFQIESFQVSIDGHPYIDISPLLTILYKQQTTSSVNLDPDTTTYNTGMYLSTKTGNTITLDSLKMLNSNDVASYKAIRGSLCQNLGLFVQFYDSVSVKFKYKQINPESDNHFTKRLKYSAQSYRLDYYCDYDTHLFGQLFGTLIDQSNISINLSMDGRHISIESFDWLLPKSGAFVVMGNK